MNKFLGENWRTTIWGFVTIVAGVITYNPELVSFLPEPIKGYAVGFSGLVTVIAAGGFVAHAKDKNVTGGTIPSTHEAEKRVDKDK